MLKTFDHLDRQFVLDEEIRALLTDLGQARVDGIAYDTAWVARLSPVYPSCGFEASLEWLRHNQYDDGTWGAPLVHYHDRFISTLAAIVALREVGKDSRDQRRVQRGEDALWHLVGRLGRDDSDTIGFPLLSASLVEDATAMGLEVPLPPARFAEAYRKKIKVLLNDPNRYWLRSTITYSFEGLRHTLREQDAVLEVNNSVACSPSATAGYVLVSKSDKPLNYLQQIMRRNDNGAISTFSPIDIFDIVWPLNHLRLAQAIEPDTPEIQSALELLWKAWSPESGVGTSTCFAICDLDDTAACFTILKWAGFPVNADVFRYYETDNHFCCYRGETNPALSAHIRLVAALRLCEEHPQYKLWIEKIINVLRVFDANGSFWWDKWHSSPYYINSTAIRSLHGIADDLVLSRLKWILRTQNDDGGWGYFEESTPEETAYCLEALLYWDRNVERIADYVLDAAAKYLHNRINDQSYTPLWIGKGLYTPHNPVKSAVLSAMFSYSNRNH